jgi:uncharacterized protein YozE (UPF0346 family)
MTFFQWLLNVSGQDSPIGDFANDVMEDIDWPNGNSLEIFINYLEERSASKEAVLACRRAWHYYQKEQ